MADYTVTFLPISKSARVPGGTTLLQAAAEAGLQFQSPCGGRGRCGKCLVQARLGLDEPTASEGRSLSQEQLAQGWRLACQARVIGDAVVTVPDSSLVSEHRIMVEGATRDIIVEPNLRKISLHLPAPTVEDPRSDLDRLTDALGGSVRPPDRLAALQDLPGLLRRRAFHVTAVLADGRLLSLEPGDTSDDLYGLAVDIGTTTVVAYLTHLVTGEVVAIASDLNSQAQFGDDVVSRIEIATASQDGLADLSLAVLAVINDLIARCSHEAQIDPKSIYEIAVVGNTCMTHLFLGVSPAGLGRLPFIPSFQRRQEVAAADLGLEINPHGRVYVAPNIGSFVGADTVGVILASELDRSDGLRAAIDIGTNGEIVVARDGELYACSTAAGPAFEGAKISRGMRASLGAIDAVTVDDDVHCRVIGNVSARGLCGSGLVDAIAALASVGVITQSGRMLRPHEASALPEKVSRRLVENDQGTAFVLAWADETYAGEEIALTARDVRETQLAKAAIYGGFELLLEQLDARPGDVRELLLAGAFGNYIRRESAIAIGLLPASLADRVTPIGNAAGVGAQLMLCSVAERKRAEEAAARVKHVELSERQGFYERFADAMMVAPLPA